MYISDKGINSDKNHEMEKDPLFFFGKVLESISLRKVDHIMCL